MRACGQKLVTFCTLTNTLTHAAKLVVRVTLARKKPENNIASVATPRLDCWQAWDGAFTPKSPFEVPKKLHLFMLKGPRKKTLPSCSLGFQEYEMDNASNFTRGFTPASNPKRGNGKCKWAFIYVKRAKAKNPESVISKATLGFPEFHAECIHGQCKQFHIVPRVLYPCQQA